MISKKYVCGLTLYHPDMDVIDKVKEYSKIFDKIYLFDNTEKEIKTVIDIRKIADSCENVVYLTENNNCGLPYAFNRIIDLIEDDVDYLCTLDQDSIFRNVDIRKMFKMLDLLDNESVGIIGPHIIYDINTKPNYDDILKKRRYLITSGSFLNIKAIRKCKIRYDENYFIDKFEIDLGQQLKINGYNLYMYYGSVLFQSLGEKDEKGRSNHSVLRHYYLFRNRFYYNNKFYGFPLKQVLNVLQTVRHISQIVFTEEEKTDKLKQLVRAYCDYKRKRMGKFR